MTLTTARPRLLVLVLCALLAAGGAVAGRASAQAATGVTFTFVNNSGQTIWVGALGNFGRATPNGGGWALANGASTTLNLPGDWGGRFWGRTGCSFDGAGHGHCDTGDCGGRLACGGLGGATPASLAEFTLQRDHPGWNDYFDVSFVDGFNVPMTVRPAGGATNAGDPYRCTDAGCGADLNPRCPDPLRYRNGAGAVMGCKSACDAFGTDQYCCRGAYGTPATCRPGDWPVDYAAYFKAACPHAYSYAYDDPTSTYQCVDCGYRIVFGPPGGTKPGPTAGPTTGPSTGPPGRRGAYAPTEAESYDAGAGVATQPTADGGGGENIGWIAGGDWVRYDGVDFGGGPPATQLLARVASGAPFGVSGLVELRLDSLSNPPVGTFGVAGTGGWQNWRTAPANIAGVTGVHTVFFTFASGQPADFVNVNWIRFAP
jgi:hypothetical protein